MAVTNTFSPIRLRYGAPASGSDVNRIQDALEAALKSLAASIPDAATDELSTVTAGTGAVTIGSTAPVLLESTPSMWAEFTAGGKTYAFPIWRAR